ncbi:MAG: hypothetical protein IPN01_17320 [Deltaproteobacteria bacterium]|nr:hypothetical protein [Deltaproteobacteria bacterium]
MRIERLIIHDTKRIKELVLDLPPPFHEGTPREREPWTVIIGENGTCKTTILQIIALASAGREQMNLLAGPLSRDAAGLGAMRIRGWGGGERRRGSPGLAVGCFR